MLHIVVVLGWLALNACVALGVAVVSDRPRYRSARRTTLKIVGTLHRLLYRWSAGRVGGTLRGGPVLLLTATGRKTGRAHTWPLCYLVAGNELVLVASAQGAPSHPAWYLNLRADGCVSVQRRGRTQMMVARTVHGAERARLWERVVRQYPVCTAYQRQTDREMPVVLLRPATSVGGHVPAREEGTTRTRTVLWSMWLGWYSIWIDYLSPRCRSPPSMWAMRPTKRPPP
jgi:F420H(2)-dependent quinone reductase